MTFPLDHNCAVSHVGNTSSTRVSPHNDSPQTVSHNLKILVDQPLDVVHNKGSSETLLTNISQLTWDLQTPNRPPTRTPFYRDDRDYSLRAVRLELLVRRGSSCPARLPTISSDIVMWFTLRSGCSSFKDNNGPHNEPGHHATGFVLPAFHDTPRNLKA